MHCRELDVSWYARASCVFSDWTECGAAPSQERVRLAKADARELRAVVSDLQQQLGERTQALDEAAAAMREAGVPARLTVRCASVPTCVCARIIQIINIALNKPS